MSSNVNVPAQFSERAAKIVGADYRVFQAPGRINLIGEHTDYNLGYVLPCAIQLRTWIAAAPSPDGKVHVHSRSYVDAASFALSETKPLRLPHWSSYVQGVANALSAAGHAIHPLNVYIESNVPEGAGLSSSAALEVATALAFLGCADLTADPTDVAKLCRSAENNFVGVQSGVMDQMTVCNGRDGHAILLDCRSLEMQYVPIPENAALIACNTMVKHELASGEYNRRREECEEAARTMGIASLRDLSPGGLNAARSRLTPVLYRRCRHVVLENQRVLDATAALQAADLERLGALMNASHESLRDDYEVSCAELDLMWNLAVLREGVYGARMTGGGFGGCVLLLADRNHGEQIAANMKDAYRSASGIDPDVYLCVPSNGAGEVLP